jgi:hypothetical protein
MITESELHLYRKALEKKGNDWKGVLQFFVQNKNVLNSVVAEKYEKAWLHVENKEVVKPIRNRLGNIGRRVKDSPEVRRREERNVYEAKSMTAEELVLKMKKVRQEDIQDPLNMASDFEPEKAARPLLGRDEPSCSNTALESESAESTALFDQEWSSD